MLRRFREKGGQIISYSYKIDRGSFLYVEEPDKESDEQEEKYVKRSLREFAQFLNQFDTAATQDIGILKMSKGDRVHDNFF